MTDSLYQSWGSYPSDLRGYFSLNKRRFLLLMNNNKIGNI